MASSPSLSSRLLSIEKDFISSVVNGEDAILAFNNRWERLVQDVDAALESTGLDDETVSLVHMMASRVAYLADISADIYTSYNDFTTELVVQIDSMMSELKLVDVTSPSILSSSSESPDLLSSRNVCGKRRRTSSPSPRSKRPRTVSTVLSTETVYSPLPPSNDSFSLFSTSHTSPNDSQHASIPSSSSSCTSTSVAVSSRRKRRLSDADASCPISTRKRPHLGPRLHAVSDSFVASHTGNEGPQTGPPLSTISTCSLAASNIVIPLEFRSVGENEVGKFSRAADTSFIQISNTDINWLNEVVAPVPPQNSDGLDIFLDSLLDPVGPFDGLAGLDSWVSLSPIPILPPWSTTLLAPTTPPLDAHVDHLDSPSTVTLSLSRPITPVLGCAGAMSDCVTIIPADSMPLGGNQNGILTSDLPWDSVFGHPESEPWMPTSSPYPASLAGCFEGKDVLDGAFGNTTGLFVPTLANATFANVETVGTKDTGFVM